MSWRQTHRATVAVANTYASVVKGRIVMRLYRCSVALTRVAPHTESVPRMRTYTP